MTRDDLVNMARVAVTSLGDGRPLDHASDWNHYQLARGVIELLDSAKSSTGPANIDRLRAIVSGVPSPIGYWRPEIQALLDVFDAACAWRDERCGRMPDCDPYDGSHDDGCEIEINRRRLDAAVNKARGA